MGSFNKKLDVSPAPIRDIFLLPFLCMEGLGNFKPCKISTISPSEPVARFILEELDKALSLILPTLASNGINSVCEKYCSFLQTSKSYSSGSSSGHLPLPLIAI